MILILDLNKSLEENASHYFDQAKLAKKKLERAKSALEESRKKLIELDRKSEDSNKDKVSRQKRGKREWFEKFRWFKTSEDFLVVGGRDATTNEIIIKKHADKEDVVFHTEMSGSPFVVLKTGSKKPSEISLMESAQFTACYSKAWKAGRTIMDVFYVNPDQVTKETPSGEYITKGSFMIYGKKNFITSELKLFVGRTDDGKIMAGPENAVRKHCSAYLELSQGDAKPSETSSIALMPCFANNLAAFKFALEFK